MRAFALRRSRAATRRWRSGAEMKSLSAADAEKYADEFVGAQVGKNDEQVAAALKADLTGGDMDLSDHRLRRKHEDGRGDD
jgi:hypothetical protein